MSEVLQSLLQSSTEGNEPLLMVPSLTDHTNNEGHDWTPGGAIKAFRLEKGRDEPPICLSATRRWTSLMGLWWQAIE